MRDKENNPNSVDAIQRVAKAVLETIAPCKNAILKDSLISEAANALGLPKEALQDEVSRTKVKPIAPKENAPEDTLDASGDESSDESSDDDVIVREVTPSPVEFSMMSALACSENDAEVKSFLKGALEKAPQLLQKFSCPFVRNFVSAFLSHETMPLAAFGETLSVVERPWFDDVMAMMPPHESTVLSAFKPSDVVRSMLAIIYRRP